MEKKIKEIRDYKPLVTSIVKKDVHQLRDYVDNLNSVLKDPGAVAIKICDCCINVTISRPGKEEYLKFSVK